MADQQGTPDSLAGAGFSREFMEIAERSQYIVNDWLRRTGLDGSGAALEDSQSLATVFLDMTSKMMSIPASVVTAHVSLWQDYFSLWQSTTNRLLGAEAPAPGGEPPHRLPSWQDADIFGYLRQSLLLTSRWIHAVGKGSPAPLSAPGVDSEACVRQFVASLSSAEFSLNNPELLRSTIESAGENLVTGLANLLKELDADGVGRGLAGRESFVVGASVAGTDGKVIYRDPLMEVIQYAPQTEQVFRVPVLFVPAWTERYYVLDLRQTNSMVRWAVDHGHTVFMISWVEPQDGSAGADFDDYLMGVRTAIDVADRAAGGAGVNAVGHALGGTLLATALAHLASDAPERVRSASFLTSLLDFAQPGELGVLMDDAAMRLLGVASAERAAERVVERAAGRTADRMVGGEPALVCALQLQTDLMWSFVVNNLLLGHDPFPFDLLHWNHDSPRLPRAAHTFYLDALYRHNRLAEHGTLDVAGRGIDLGAIKLPTYFLSAREDHVAPWKSAYRSMRLLGGPRRFTLTASGHLAGVINPPAFGRYCYWTNPRTPDNPDEWRAAARTLEGSWWRDWNTWLRQWSGDETVPARSPGGAAFAPLGDAPGLYVTGRA